MRCTLKKKGFLARWLEVETSEGKFDVIYRGFHGGYEQIVVDGKVAAHKTTVLWFAPRFDFKIGTAPATIEVRVWAWLKIKSFTLTVANQTIYSEEP